MAKVLRKKNEECKSIRRAPGKTNGENTQSTCSIKLPKLTLKTFTGDPLEWLTFWNSFRSAVDQNSGLSDIDRMNYLTGLLRGEGARAISGLALTNSNYTKALELLKSRSELVRIKR